MENFETLQEVSKCNPETQSEQVMLKKNDADRSVQCRVDTNLQFVQKPQSPQSTIKWSKLKWGMPVLYSIGCVALGNSGDRPKRKCNSVELFSFHSIVTFYLCVLGRLYSEQYYFLKYFPLVNRTRVKI